jgi:hypothetical protein
MKELVEHIEQLSRLDKRLGVDIDGVKPASVETLFDLACSLSIIAPFGGGQPRPCPDHRRSINRQSLAVQPLQDRFDRGNAMHV